MWLPPATADPPCSNPQHTSPRPSYADPMALSIPSLLPSLALGAVVVALLWTGRALSRREGVALVASELARWALDFLG